MNDFDSPPSGPSMPAAPLTAGQAWPVASSAQRLAAAALLVALTLFAYLPALSGGFLLDDDQLLTDNHLIQAPDGLYLIWFTTEPLDYWPLSNTLLWIEWRLWGMHPTGYHVVNLLLHLGVALLIWRLLRRLAIPGAYAAALLFALHPVNVDSVAWIAQTKTVLAMLFLLLSILWYLNAEAQPGDTQPFVRRWYWMSWLGCTLAVLSKVSAAVSPVLLLGVLAWRRPLQRRDLLRLTPFFVVVAVLLRVNLWFRTHGLEIPPAAAGTTERLLGAAGVVWFYLCKGLLPTRLAIIYPEWHVASGEWIWWLAVLAVITLSAVLWHYRDQRRLFLFAWGWFCVSLLPVMGFTDVGLRQHLVVADHYLYVGLAAMTAAVAAQWSAWRDRITGPIRWVPSAVALGSIGMFVLLSSQQSALYADSLTLYEAALRRNPEAWLAHNNLGTLLSQAGRYREGIEHYEQALRLQPNYKDARNNLGAALADEGRLPEAIAEYELVLRDNPDFADAHYNFGNALSRSGRLQEATGEYRQALGLTPNYAVAQRAKVHAGLGDALAQLGDLPAAVLEYQRALQLKPDFGVAHDHFGKSLALLGRLPEAIGEYRAALQSMPDSAETHYNLGNALAQSDDLQGAIAEYQEALRIHPGYAEAHNNLGSALAQSGQAKDAVEHYQEALRLDPDFSDARHNLEAVRALQKTP